MLCHQKDEAGMEVPKCLKMETEYVFFSFEKEAESLYQCQFPGFDVALYLNKI